MILSFKRFKVENFNNYGKTGQFEIDNNNPKKFSYQPLELSAKAKKEVKDKLLNYAFGPKRIHN